jgi:hypothetical protein
MMQLISMNQEAAKSTLEQALRLFRMPDKQAWLAMPAQPMLPPGMPGMPPGMPGAPPMGGPPGMPPGVPPMGGPPPPQGA